MNFQDIKQIKDSKAYLDVAFSKASKKAQLTKKSSRMRGLDFAKNVEIAKLDVVSTTLAKRFNVILEDFPSFSKLSPFYVEICENNIDMDKIRKALSTLGWAIEKISEIRGLTNRKIIKANDEREVYTVSRGFYGRVSSIARRLEKHLDFLENSRRLLRELPDVKEDVFTICIAGFPNAGKSTLLSNITTSKPEIRNYAFTTKKLNIGYMSVGLRKVQLIDTPGTLARFDKMNAIEKQAYLAIKHLSNAVVYVYDLTEMYPLTDQETLAGLIADMERPMIYYLSKTDILPKDVVDNFISKNKDIKFLTSIKELTDSLKELTKKNR